MTRRLLDLAYRVGLRVLPRSFRRRWHAELLAAFRERLRAQGAVGGVRELSDLLLTCARLRLGALTTFERSGEGGMALFRGVVLDLRAVARSLRRQPAYALAAVCTLAVGVGATTALFGVFDRVVVQPLPHADADRLYMVWRALPEYEIERAPSSYPTYLDLGEGVDAFGAVGAYAMSAAVTVAAAGEPERVAGAHVSGTLFELLGNRPLHGRVITAADDDPAADPVIVLSRRLWERQFGGSPTAIGGTLRIGDVPHRIVGVMPDDFIFPAAQAEFWIPLRTTTAASERDTHRFSIVARLGAGVGPELARAQVEAAHARLQAAFPEVYPGSMWLERRQDFIVGDAAAVLRALLWAALFLAVAASANFAGMLIVRAIGRRRETAVALALGAGRFRSARPLVLESMLLSLTGCGAGVLLAASLIRGVQILAPDSLPRRAELGLDARSLLFAAGLSVVTGVVCTLVAAWRLSRQTDAGGMAAAMSRPGERASKRTQSALVVAQVTAAFVLLTGSALFTTSLVKLLNVPVGFDREHVLTAWLSLPPAEYDSPARIASFYDDVLASLRATPGVSHAGGTWALPFSEDYASTTYTVGDAPDDGVAVSATAVRGEYFDAVGMRLLRGRPFDTRDAADAAPVVIVNETMARHLFGAVDPVGRRIVKPGSESAATVVGVVNDVRRRELSADVEPEVYYPHDQAMWNGDFYVVLRTDGDPAAMAPELRRAVRAQDPTLPVMRLATLGERVSRSVAEPRFRTFVLLALAAAAGALAVLGTYGALSWVVVSTRRDMALRIALGADPRRLVRDVIASGGRLALLGIAGGTAIAVAGAGLARSLLFGVDALEPAVYGAAALLVMAATLAAAAIPARRIGAIDAASVLRED